MNQNQTNSISLQLNRIFFFLSQGKGAWGQMCFGFLKRPNFGREPKTPEQRESGLILSLH